ncbi:hypothetical protein [Devosia sp. XK-2]|uniref:hypothetical protein n=1 Tax=Devosia sp. XK-2 TaxID=3126689 RepID=UPI0030CF484B
MTIAKAVGHPVYKARRMLTIPGKVRDSALLGLPLYRRAERAKHVDVLPKPLGEQT